MHKRIIIEHRTGRLAGLRQIVGWQGDNEQPTAFVAPINLGDHAGAIGLTRVTPRFVLYVECMGPQTVKLNEFHPSQV